MEYNTKDYRSPLSRVAEYFYDKKILSKWVPTLKSSLESELQDAASILDLGCGSDSPISHLPQRVFTVGVEGDENSVLLARSNNTHKEIIHADLLSVDFPENSFDAVVLLEVIEHMPHEMGEELINKARRWARKKLIISTPNGFWPQGALYGNELQRHVCGWTIDEFEEIGFEVKGLAGLRFLRKENEGPLSKGVTPFGATLRWKPWQLSLILSAITQVYTYRQPRFAFELLGVLESP